MTAVLRSQKWMLHAYECVGSVPEAERKDYKIAVNDLGANMLRLGLVGALAAVERIGARGELLMQHLASAKVTGLTDLEPAAFADETRRLQLTPYILASRELRELATWLKRAAQATFAEE